MLRGWRSSLVCSGGSGWRSGDKSFQPLKENHVGSKHAVKSQSRNQEGTENNLQHEGIIISYETELVSLIQHLHNRKLKNVKTKSTKWLRLHSQVRLDQLTSLRFMKQFNKWLSSWNSRQIPGSPDLSRWDGAETEKLSGKLAHSITPPPPCCTAWFWSAESDSILVQHLVSPPQQLLGSQILLSCTLISKFSPVYLWITADEIKTHLGRLRGSEPTATRIHMKSNIFCRSTAINHETSSWLWSLKPK